MVSGGGGGGGTEVARFYALVGMNTDPLEQGAQRAKASFGQMLMAGVGLGSGMQIVNTAINLVTGAIRGSVNAAMTYEVALAQVQKVTGASREETQLLGRDLTQMSREIPVARNELAGIAKVAAQLGIEGRANITGFTETVAKMSTAAEMGTEETALALGRLSLLMQRPIETADRLSSSIFGVASAGASSERQIVEFAERIAGAGKIVGMTDSFIIGLSGTLASLGVEAEAGGTAMQNAFLRFNEAVIEGKDQLGLLAAVSGMSKDQFKKQWETDAAGAFQAFIVGLGKSGDAATSILKALDVDNARSARAFLALAQSPQELARQVNVAAGNINDASRLNQAYATTAGTAQAEVDKFKNSVTGLAGAIGTGLVGALAQVAGPLANFIDQLAKATITDANDPRARGWGAPFAWAGSGAPKGPHIKTRDEIDMESELGAPRGMQPGYQNTAVPLTPEQQALKDMADRMNAGSGGGAGAQSPEAQAAQRMQERLESDRVDARIKGGDSEVARVRSAQAVMLAAWDEFAADLAEDGVKIPALFFDAFVDNWQSEAKKAGARSGQTFEGLMAFMQAKHTGEGTRDARGNAVSSRSITINGGIHVVAQPGQSARDAARPVMDTLQRAAGFESVP